ncbi:MAG TPA: GNVR domain-containing protein [Candidatus Omnitrophota bacterium]|nr:GNVR domain-containing protein [Candidatus Omnitrophota bacterium]
MNIDQIGQTFRIREYYYMVVRHKFWLFTSMVVCFLIAAILAFALPKMYRAETVLLVEDQKLLNPLIAGLAISPSAASRMRTLKEELLAWQRLTLVVEKLKLNDRAKNPVEFEKLIKHLRESIAVRFKGGDIITVAYEGREPQKAQAIVQTLADIIIHGTIATADLEANSAIRFIQDQLDEYRGKLELSEQKLREFREIYGNTLPVATRMNEQIVQLKIDLQNMLVDNTEEHPRVVATKKLISQLEGQRDSYMQQATQEGAKITPEEYAKLVTSVPLQEQQLAKLQRDYQVNSELYQKLLQRLETAKISQTLEKSDKGTKFKVLEPARLPLVPVKPNKPLFMLGGLFIGIALGVVLVYLIDVSDTSIRNAEEARNLLEKPILGSISPIRPEELLMGEALKAGAHG